MRYMYVLDASPCHAVPGRDNNNDTFDAVPDALY